MYFGYSVIIYAQIIRNYYANLQSTSLWGRELKDQDSDGMNNINTSTSLWGRELKEKYVCDMRNWARSTSLWGRELKVRTTAECFTVCFCRPPCEVVSWKNFFPCCVCLCGCVDLLVRSWVERNMAWRLCSDKRCRPPCEVVSWKDICRKRCLRSNLSTSLWGRELKGPCYVRWRAGTRSTSLWGRELKEGM